MLTLEQIKIEAEDITYLDWTLFVGQKNDVPYLQWSFTGADNDHPENTELQKCRKWMLSYHMTYQEIERTAFLALQQAVSHEMCENYRYRGAQIRHPHMCPIALAAMMHDDNPVVRREEPDTKLFGTHIREAVRVLKGN
jgi:hypothetical protein